MVAWARTAGLRGALVALLAAPVAIAPWTATPASARSCDDLTGVVTATGGHTEALLTLPASSTGALVPTSALAVSQHGLPVEVLSLGPVPAARTDVVVVVDTSAAAAEPVAAAVRTAAGALLAALPAGTARGVVSTGGGPAVVHGLGRTSGGAVAAVSTLSFAGPNHLVDAVLAAARLLPVEPGRQQQVAVVAAGPDRGSATSWRLVADLLHRRGTALDVIDLGPEPSLPKAGAQCPGSVPVTSAAAAGAALAGQIDDRRRLVLPAVRPDQPVTATLTLGSATATTVLERRDQRPAANGSPGQVASHAAGAGTLLLAIVVGLAAVGLVLLVAAGGSRQGADGRRVIADLVRVWVLTWRERRLPEDERRMPPAEARRRLSQSWQDLNALLGGGQSSRVLAEAAAYDEDLERAAAAERSAVLAQRAEAQRRAAERRSRSTRQAVTRAAEARAMQDLAALQRGVDVVAPADLTNAERRSYAAVLEATRRLAEQRAAAEAATERRLAAERAADEAADRARLEQAAAARAQEARVEAERAAAEAQALADRDQKSAGKASAARKRAEAAAVQATRKAESELVAARAAEVRRETAMAEAAAAEAAQQAAVLREREARRAADAAEASRTAVVARLDERREAVSAGGSGGAGAAGGAGEIDLRERADLASKRADSSAAAAESRPRMLHVVAEAGAAAAPDRPDVVPGPVRPTLSSPVPPAAGGPPPDVPVQPDVHAAGDASTDPTDPSPLAAAGPAVILVRLAAVAWLPAVAVVRTVLQGAWWQGAGLVGWTLLGMSLLLALLGVAWLWVATRVPHTLLPGTRRALLAATRRHQVSTDAASRLLAELRAAAPADEAWARFEDETGLHLPRFARWVIDPAMDPAALVRYLSARQLQGAAAPQSLARVTLVPVILCLVPAAVLLLLV